jgi:molybdopterin/thiamine biosynthesis adenylyltransferase
MKVDVNNGVGLTPDELELYDRQIRLWGVESQMRLKKARVLVIGMNGLGAEIVKNVVLSGVETLTMMDDALANEKDSHSQFLIPPGSLGTNRAVASLERAQALNPLVKVKAESANVQDKPDEFFVPWDVIIASGLNTKQYNRIDELCRANSVKFFSGDVFGMFGYMFSDLQSHEYVEQVTTTVKSEVITNTIKETIQFPSFDDAFEVDFTSDEHRSELLKLDPTYFIIKMLLKFRETERRDPDPALHEEDYQKLLKLRDEEVSNLPYLKEKISDEVFNMIFSQLSPVCAIIGGVLAQEVVKALTRKGEPNNNILFYNPITNYGQVVSVGN